MRNSVGHSLEPVEGESIYASDDDLVVNLKMK